MKIAGLFRRATLVRSAVVGLVALLVGGMLALGMTAPAFASTPTNVTLKLTNKAGAALTGYDVYPIDVSNGAETPTDNPLAASQVTGKSGYYLMTGLNAGDSYTLLFVPNGAAANSGTIQFLGGTAGITGAATFVPTAGTYFLGASIATGGTITGKVTGPTGAALKNAEVDAYQFDGTNWVTQNYTVTSSSGSFSFANAVPGAYKFEFYASGGVYPPIYSGGAATLDAAASTFVSVGATSTVNQKFVVGTGSISGTVSVFFPANAEFAAGNLNSGMIPVAIPVTAQSGGVATALDLDKSIAGAGSSGSGAWTIKNLPAGSYVVQLEPTNYGEFSTYVGTISNNEIAVPLSGATILSVTAGHVTATGEMDLQGSSDFDGSDPQFTINGSNGNALEHAEVQLYPTTDPLDYVTGTSNSAGLVTLTDQSGGNIFDDGAADGADNPLEPGEYTLVVIDPSNANDPYKQDIYLDFGEVASTITLPAFQGLPGFSSAASINSSATAVGTSYTASATASRTDAVKSYQWLRDGQPIYGATSVSYTSTGADYGHEVGVRVTASSFGFAPVYSSAFVAGGTAETLGAAPANTVKPSITPSTGIFIGTTLSANVGSWTLGGQPATGLSFTYNWLVGGNSVDENASTFVVGPTVGTQPVTVQVFAHKTGFADSGYVFPDSPVYPQLHPAALVTKAPTSKAKVKSGVTTWTVTTGTWNTTGLTFSYAWFNGSNPVGTNSNSITSTTIGGAPGSGGLTVFVTASKAGYVSGTSAAVAAAKGTMDFTRSAPAVIHDVTTNTDSSGDTFGLNLGDQLTVSQPGTYTELDNLSPSAFTYQWFRNGVAIKGATTKNYTIATADLVPTNDAEISVVETPVSVYFSTVPSAAVDAGEAKALTLSASVGATVSGGHEVGQTDTAVAPTWQGLTPGHTTPGTVTGITETYAWSGCLVATPCSNASNPSTFTAITGATKSTLVISALYSAVAVTETAHKTGYITVSSTSVAYAVVAPTTVVNTSVPTVSGVTSATAHVGVKLTAGAGKWVPSGTTYTYAWQTQSCTAGNCNPANWVTVGTLSTYTPVASDYTSGLGRIRVVVTANKNSVLATAASADYPVAPGTAKATTAPKLTIAASTESVTSGVYSPTGGTVGYQWFVDGASDVATASRTRDLVGDVGKAITVRVTYSTPGYPDVVTNFIAQRGTGVAGTAAFNGSAYGSPLSAHLGSAFSYGQSEAPTYSYQWYSNGAKVKGATGQTFSPSSSYIGKAITVTITAKTDVYNDLTTAQSSPSTLTVGTFAVTDAASVTASGAVQPGTVLTTHAVITDPGLTGYALKYAWLRSTDGGTNWTTIAGATKTTYTVVATDVTTKIESVITLSKAGYTTAPLTSNVATVAYAPDLAPLTAPTLVGGAVGAATTVNVGTWNAPTLTFSYVWYRNGIVIPGVTSASWTPTADSAGDDIVVSLTATRAGYQPVTVQTQEVTIQLGAAPVATVAPVITKVSTPALTYTVTTGTWSVDGLTYAYQWKIGGVDAIGTGATTPTYTSDGSQHGTLTVEVTVSRAGYATAPVKIATFATAL